MKKFLAFCLSAMVLLASMPLVMVGAVPDTNTLQYVFNEDCTWSGNAAKDVTGGYLKITNSSSGGYNHIGSGNGFSKNLSGADAIRLYIKNSTDSDISLFVYFMDALAHHWQQAVTIKGGSNEFVAYDYPLDSFTYRYSNNGEASNLVEGGTTWAAAKEAGKLTANNYNT